MYGWHRASASSWTWCRTATKQGMRIALETSSFSAAVEFENRQAGDHRALTEEAGEATPFLGRRSPVYRRR